jgi:A/G-specific adenine glycosylase
MATSFARLLLKWNKEQNTRQMPWKGEKNPYLIWLSEIILQQTRVEQGMPYFLRFREKYPTVRHLAEAPEDGVMKLWQGLGYYSRARNLHETAKTIEYQLKGKFPNRFDELKKLKGVGDYTAAAIASFAFNEPKAVIDGNVIRVLARIFGIEAAADTTEGKKQFANLAQQLIDKKEPGTYNQAIMDFGATICLPQNPKCGECPFNKICIAFLQGRIENLPTAKKKIKIKRRFFNYLLISTGDEILIEKRIGSDIWKNLYQLPLIETDKPLKRDFAKSISTFLRTAGFSITGYSDETIQMLTHQRIHFKFIEVKVKTFKSLKTKGFQPVKLKQLEQYAFPKTIHQYLQQKGLTS